MTRGSTEHDGGEIDQVVVAYYGRGAELGRLAQGRSQLERARTESLLGRYLPPPPADILDVGGGPGVYASRLSAQGYHVKLVDPVPLHVEEAMRVAAVSGHPLAGAELGDARRLEQAAASVDVVLLMGPLYHLTERADRLAALHEAARVLRSGGLLIAIAISRFASLLDGLSSGFLEDPAFAEIVAEDLNSGRHRNPDQRPGYFTTAFFHRPEELRAEVTEAGLRLTDLVGVEGPSWWVIPDFERRWQEPVWREHLMQAAETVEREPSLLGLGPHLMAVARKQ